ncbi:endonuclease/exonuclease/phosphatase family protein [Thalassotalea profundi]|uniref:Endonuclease/exonuclease/phosphatase domain-containing protein n=1 Tax=Thalassotalea profundi TaxID=2036687 RepID=A0ABQ3INH8_9GAMM|nr:endonuclease/exonuclease/phosphatase family protein [Thalassotalea profundi]GHE89482.1 hypothetical protein GCM10011501_18800 [Thalassotalea profundi]
MLDFQININPLNTNKNSKPSFTLITANIGEGIELKKLKAAIRFYNPDVFLFQESGRLLGTKVFKSYPFQDCKNNLCFISKYPFKKINSLNNAMYKGYGDWAAFYELKINNEKVNIVNVHFPSVRSIFPRFSNIAKVHSNRELAALIISSWGASKNKVIISGDFNMSTSEGIYRRTFNQFNNALSIQGNGFNNTLNYNYKGLKLPGVRIDHILFSDEFNIEKATVLETLGGDHYPVLSQFSLKEADLNE